MKACEGGGAIAIAFMEDLHVSLKLYHIINFILCEGNRLRLRRSFVKYSSFERFSIFLPFFFSRDTRSDFGRQLFDTCRLIGNNLSKNK